MIVLPLPFPVAIHTEPVEWSEDQILNERKKNQKTGVERRPLHLIADSGARTFSHRKDIDIGHNIVVRPGCRSAFRAEPAGVILRRKAVGTDRTGIGLLNLFIQLLRPGIFQRLVPPRRKLPDNHFA